MHIQILTAHQQNSGHISKRKREQLRRQVSGSEDRILINRPRTQDCATSKMKVHMCGAIMEYASELRQDANNGQQRQTMQDFYLTAQGKLRAPGTIICDTRS